MSPTIKKAKYTLLAVFFSILSIIFFLIFHTTNKQVIEIPEAKKLEMKMESDSLFSELSRLRDKMKTIDVKDSMLIEIVDSKRSIIDTLITKSIKYKDNQVELLSIRKTFNDLRVENRVFFTRIDALNAKNNELKIMNDSIKVQLEDATTMKNGLAKKLETITRTASQIKVSGVRVIAYTVTAPLFGKPKKVKTTISSKVKSIEISFTLPENPLAKPSSLAIKAYIFDVPKGSSVSKGIDLMYNGAELSHTLIFDENLKYNTGTHKIFITLDDKQTYSGDLVLE